VALARYRERDGSVWPWLATGHLEPHGKGRFAHGKVFFSSGYRCSNGLGHIGGTEISTKNTIRTRNDTVGLVSVPARHGHSIVRGPLPQHIVLARARHG